MPGLPAPPSGHDAGLQAILQEIRTMSQSVNQLGQSITELQADVTRSADVTQSAVTLIQGFAQRLQDAITAAQAEGVTPDQLQALTALHASVSANSDALAAAVTANTPSQGGDATPTGDIQPAAPQA
jgi:type II secretory pathway component PulM